MQLDEDAGELVHRSTFDHPYPATKIMWIPDQKGTFPDLLATSGDYLRLWRVSFVYIETISQFILCRLVQTTTLESNLS